jgi:AAT family amino acid transporter
VSAEGSLDPVERETGLARRLGSGQMLMIAIGGAIGTGLFLGAGLAVGYAGPGVVFSYAIAAVIAYMLMLCLLEMAVAHPTAGSFGVYSELYIGKWAGFTVRYTYWAAQALAIGGEATAVGLYMQFWIPGVPVWVWVLVFAVTLVYVNARAVNTFGTFEYWFAMIKVVAIIAFIIVGLILILGINGVGSAYQNYTGSGGFLPYGLSGVWLAVLIGIFSFYGTEVVAVTSGEAEDPGSSIPRALRGTVLRLVLFYILALAIMVAIIPWTEVGTEVVSESPFVRALADIGIPGAASIMNFVVLTAALSSMNTNLYLCTRMIYSLSRGGYAPKALGRLSEKRVPLNALLVSSVGLAIAMALNLLTPDAWGTLFGVAIFGGIFVWIMIFIAFLRFRPRWQGEGLPVRAPLYPVLPITGAALLAAILLTMLSSPDWRFAWYAGVPFLALLVVLYLVFRRRIGAETRTNS